MKLKSKIFYLVLAVAGIFASCSKDFLDRPPLSEISTENFYQNSSDLKLATAALYAGSPWGEWTYTSYLTIGDVMSGNMVLGYNDDAVQLNTFSVTGLNGAVVANWKVCTRSLPIVIPRSMRSMKKHPNLFRKQIKMRLLAKPGLSVDMLITTWLCCGVTFQSSKIIPN